MDLDDEQEYDRDDRKKIYIMWKALHKKGIEKIQ